MSKQQSAAYDAGGPFVLYRTPTPYGSGASSDLVGQATVGPSVDTSGFGSGPDKKDDATAASKPEKKPPVVWSTNYRGAGWC